MTFEFDIIIDALPALLEGAKLTWYITLLGLLGGMTLGVLAGLGRTAGTRQVGIAASGIHIAINRTLQTVSFAYVELIRGTPIIVQAMFIYFAMPMLFEVLFEVRGVRLDAVTAAVITIAINAGAYIAEIVRGSVLSINKGLIEAGLATGITRFQLYANIVGPLALRRMIPPLGNQFIISLKDTSLFIVIGVGELTRQGQEIMASNFRALEIWSAVAVIYLIMTSILAFALKFFERKMRII